MIQGEVPSMKVDIVHKNNTLCNYSVYNGLFALKQRMRTTGRNKNISHWDHASTTGNSKNKKFDAL